MRELRITVKMPRINEAQIGTAFTNYRLRNMKKSEQILLDEIHSQLERRNMVVTRDLWESFEAVDLEETSDMSRAVVGSDDVAARVAEYGAQPAGGGSGGGGEMGKEILQWIKDKGISPSYGTQEQMAFAVTRAIAEKGQPLKGGLKRPLNAAQKSAKRKIDALWESDLQNLLKDLELK